MKFARTGLRVAFSFRGPDSRIKYMMPTLRGWRFSGDCQKTMLGVLKGKHCRLCRRTHPPAVGQSVSEIAQMVIHQDGVLNAGGVVLLP